MLLALQKHFRFTFSYTDSRTLWCFFVQWLASSTAICSLLQVSRNPDCPAGVATHATAPGACFRTSVQGPPQKFVATAQPPGLLCSRLEVGRNYATALVVERRRAKVWSQFMRPLSVQHYERRSGFCTQRPRCGSSLAEKNLGKARAVATHATAGDAPNLHDMWSQFMRPLSLHVLRQKGEGGRNHATTLAVAQQSESTCAAKDAATVAA